MMRQFLLIKPYVVIPTSLSSMSDTKYDYCLSVIFATVRTLGLLPYETV